MDTPSAQGSIRSQWAKRLVREKLAAELNILISKHGNSKFYSPASGGWTPHNLPPDPNYAKKQQPPNDDIEKAIDLPERKVCIVGAGVAGLYIAMILKDLEIPNLKYDIVEANSRTGGRVYTHRFSNEKHDYYDVGAMRFPYIDSMKRAFDLFKLTEMPLIDYHLEGGDVCPKLFNDRFFVKDEPDPYHISQKNGGSVSDKVVDSVDDILKQVFGPYKKALADNFEVGFAKLLTVDNFSTREYLKRGGSDFDEDDDEPRPRYGFQSIQWIETQNTSTNLFDQAFSESVMDSFDFDNPKKDGVKWHCIDGGTSRLIEAMEKMAGTEVEKNKRVEAISLDSNRPDEEDNMSVKIVDEEHPREGYCTVFSTTSLGCLGRMDLRGLNLHPSQKDAIRSLHYDDSAKVALKFSYPWWIVDCKITKGGSGSTDLPLRTCVYPSYNLNDGPDKPAVLLASYTWAQDATRIGSITNSGQPHNEDELVELLLRNLARLHAQNIDYDKIKKAYMGIHHAYSWSHDPTTSGAFALYGPGQFRHLYPYLTRPAADSKFHIVGEASSAHHAWIVGSLDSAYMAVYRFLERFKLWEYIARLEERWGEVAELDTGENGTTHIQLALGMLDEEDQFKVAGIQ